MSLTNALLSVNIEALIVCMNVHENMPLHVITHPRAKENITGCEFTKKGFFMYECDENFPSFSMFTLFYYVHYTYVKWIHTLQILQICKFYNKIGIDIHHRLIVLQSYQI